MMNRQPASRSPYEASYDLEGFDLAMAFRRILSAVRRNLWIVLISSLLFAVLGGALSLRQEPYYDAQASLIIDPRIGERIDSSSTNIPYLSDALVVDSEVEVLRSERLLRRVVEKLGMVETSMARLVEEGGEIPEEEVLKRSLTDVIANNLRVGRDGETFIIRINTRAITPQLAADIANTVADEYFTAQLDARIEQAEQVEVWLSDELESMGTRVIEAETNVERFMFENDVPDENVIGAVEQELTETDRAIIAGRLTLRKAQAEIDEIDRAKGLEGTAGLEAQRQLATALGGDSGIVLSRIGEELGNLREVRQALIQITRTEMKSLGLQSKELKLQLSQISTKQVELRKMRREAEALQAQYENLLDLFEQNQGKDRFVRNSARIIERAAPPERPANPKLKAIVPAAAIGGLIVGLGLIFLREQFNDSLRSSDDVTRALGLPYMGPLPRLRRRDVAHVLPELEERTRKLRRGQRREIARLTHAANVPFSLLAETFRRTFFKVRSTKEGEGCRVIAATSAMSGDGKSFFASNLAFFLAKQGHKVMLIDGDVRKPYLTRAFAPIMEEPVAGASGEDRDQPIIASRLIENLYFMYRRDHESLADAEQQMKLLPELIELNQEHFDFIVLDTAPLAYVSDSLFLASIIDSAVLVVNWGRTSAGTLRRILAANSPVAEKIIGVGLSKISTSAIKSYEFIPASDNYYRPDVTAKKTGRSSR